MMALHDFDLASEMIYQYIKESARETDTPAVTKKRDKIT
jgi:hypothetical protein